MQSDAGIRLGPLSCPLPSVLVAASAARSTAERNGQTSRSLPSTPNRSMRDTSMVRSTSTSVSRRSFAAKADAEVAPQRRHNAGTMPMARTNGPPGEEPRRPSDVRGTVVVAFAPSSFASLDRLAPAFGRRRAARWDRRPSPPASDSDARPSPWWPPRTFRCPCVVMCMVPVVSGARIRTGPPCADGIGRGCRAPDFPPTSGRSAGIASASGG